MKAEHKHYKWEVLALLWMAYLLNQADRQVFNTVLPAIRDALDLTDTSVGMIATIFNLCYAFILVKFVKGIVHFAHALRVLEE